MSGQFAVDVVATPRLDLCGATARDLNYRDANGKFPAASRSQMAKEQEKLNKFLQYVNESFIIKGFSKASAQERSNVRGYTSGNSAPALIRASETSLCDFQLAHGGRAQIQVTFSITGEAAASGTAPAVLTVKILENNAQVAIFRQAVSGVVTVSAPFLLVNRQEGVTQIAVQASVSGGELCVEKYGAFASALVME